ncbi:hypothetical protein EV426DRAFT_705435 [Tirmania nivea]|nr:hypothetical protein EV426DRAFT_705435 [Tirmania nivea]
MSRPSALPRIPPGTGKAGTRLDEIGEVEEDLYPPLPLGHGRDEEDDSDKETGDEHPEVAQPTMRTQMFPPPLKKTNKATRGPTLENVTLRRPFGGRRGRRSKRWRKREWKELRRRERKSKEALRELGKKVKKAKAEMWSQWVTEGKRIGDIARRKVGQQLEKLRTSRQHHEIALTVDRKIYSDIGGTTIANLPPSFEDLELFLSLLLNKPTLNGYWLTIVLRALAPQEMPDTASESPSTYKQHNCYRRHLELQLALERPTQTPACQREKKGEHHEIGTTEDSGTCHWTPQPNQDVAGSSKPEVLPAQPICTDTSIMTSDISL